MESVSHWTMYIKVWLRCYHVLFFFIVISHIINVQYRLCRCSCKCCKTCMIMMMVYPSLAVTCTHTSLTTCSHCLTICIYSSSRVWQYREYLKYKLFIANIKYFTYFAHFTQRKMQNYENILLSHKSSKKKLWITVVLYF